VPPAGPGITRELRLEESALQRSVRLNRFAAPGAALILAMLVFAPSASAQTWYMGQEPTKEKPDTTLTITVHPLAPGVFAARVRYGWVGWFVQGKGITMVDAGMDDYAASALADTMRARSGDLPIRYVIATHDHDDHIQGAKRFLAGGARLIAQAKVAAVIDSALGRPHVTTAAEKGAEPSTILVERTKTLGTGDEMAEIIWLGHPAHTAADMIVYLPKKRILFAGDVVSYLAVPWMLDPGMSVPGWQASVDSILTGSFEVDSLVPGHGQIGSKRQAAGWMKRYLMDSWDKASQVAAWGTKITGYKEWGYLGAYENVEFYRETHFMNMRRLYNEAKGIKTPGRRGARALKY
jgi:glyoxylase-like metal-dependent hydrolase (beta-lactamase superfamily II)